MKKKKILIVEDEKIVAIDIRNTLLQFGYDVTQIVSNEKDAINSVSEQKPDLILMDILLEGEKTGIDAARKIKDNFDIPLIFLTAHINDETLDKAKEVEPYGYLMKPFEERELHAIMEMTFHKIKTEKALRKSEEKHRTLIETMEEGLIIVDEKENFTFANPAACKIFGYQEKKLISMNIRDFVTQEEFQKILDNTVLRKKGISSKYELNIFTKQDEKRVITVAATPLIVDGKFTGTFGIISDITEKQKTEKTLRELKQAVETMTIGVTVTEIDGKIIFTNRADAKMHGYEPEELLGKDVRVFAPVRIRKPMSLSQVKKWKGLIRESSNIRKDGSTFPVRLMSDIVKDGKGDPVAIITTCEDITERKQAEEALRESEERFRSTFFHAAAGMILIHPDGTIRQVNESFCFMTGYKENELLNRNINSLIHHDDVRKNKKKIKTMLTGKLNYFHIEERLIHKKGDIIWVNVSISSVNDDFGKSLYLIAQILDISEMRKVEEEIKELNRQLEARVNKELNKRIEQQQLLIQKSKLESLGKLAAGIAHEINQPLAGISMAMDNILFKLSMDKCSKDYLEKKVNSVFNDIDRIRHIIEHVRTFSRDQKSVLLEKIDINETIKNALSMVQTQYKNHNIKVILEFKDDLEFAIGNKFKLEQVILNLLNNAKDAVEDREEAGNEINFKKQITIKTYSNPHNICIEIEDNGTGIPKENLDNIFDPFFTTKDPEKGTGLGLSIIYGIIQEMKGEISVSSEKNKFTKFIIKLPNLTKRKNNDN